MTALLRILSKKTDRDSVIKSIERNWDACFAELEQRASAVGRREHENFKNVMAELHRIALSKDASSYVWDHKNGVHAHFIYGAETPVPAERRNGAFWRVLNSMRSVEADAGFQMTMKTVRIEADVVFSETDPAEEVEL